MSSTVNRPLLITFWAFGVVGNVRIERSEKGGFGLLVGIINGVGSLKLMRLAISGVYRMYSTKEQNPHLSYMQSSKDSSQYRNQMSISSLHRVLTTLDSPSMQTRASVSDYIFIRSSYTAGPIPLASTPLLLPCACEAPSMPQPRPRP